MKELTLRIPCSRRNFLATLSMLALGSRRLVAENATIPSGDERIHALAAEAHLTMRFPGTSRDQYLSWEREEFEYNLALARKKEKDVGRRAGMKFFEGAPAVEAKRISLSAAILLFLLSLPASAGPVDFGLSELKAALKERGLPRTPVPFQWAIVAGPAEGYTIRARRITGSDERGLMYGLLEAAEQIRTSGRVRDTSGSPATPVRGMRLSVNNEGLESSWYYSKEFWIEYFGLLARSRFNRFNLVFANQTAYLSPPYPFWVEVPDFPEIRAIGLTAGQRERNLEALQFISRTAQEHGIDFTLGIWAHDHPAGGLPNMPHGFMKPMVEGLSPRNLAPYTYAALKKVLASCPAIRSVQIRTNNESGIPQDHQAEFYRDGVFRALRDANRPVILDLRGWNMQPGFLESATASGVPLRLSGKYAGEQLGRPYQPGQTWEGNSYENFLERPGKSRPHEFYWELWTGSHRLLLWGSPEYVRRIVPTLTLSDSIGFEIDAPLKRKGMGNRPGPEWGIFTLQQSERVFWRYEYQRYWPWFLLFGRGSYDPNNVEGLWHAELHKRFGGAASAVAEVYAVASQVMNEIVTAHHLDPNVGVWTEINPGGVLDAYREARPMDWRVAASPLEAVQNRLNGAPSAKQTPRQTSELLRRLADDIDKAVSGARKKVEPGNKEWRSSEVDFEVLSHIARFHSHRLLAAYHLTMFYEACVPSGLNAAKTEAEHALRIWEQLVLLTDGVYPAEMVFHWQEYGHWKDKIPYLKHDLRTLDERRDVYDRLGCFDHGFDFGGRTLEPGHLPFRAIHAMIANTVEPRFRHAGSDTTYTAERGYGWLEEGERRTREIPLTAWSEIRSQVKDPEHLPYNILFGDSILGRGPQVFRLHTPDGKYKVTFLMPEKTTASRELTATDGRLDVPFPRGDWNISGFVVKSLDPRKASPVPPEPRSLPRPAITHRAPTRAVADRPLSLRLQVSPGQDIRSVRLYYRPLNQRADYEMLEQTAPEAEFTIPAERISAKWDLMYYFEILNSQASGWLYPDPRQAAPYVVVPVDRRR